jgi:hypothetical protein
MNFLDCLRHVELQRAANRFPLTENVATYKQMMGPVIQAMNTIHPGNAGAISDQTAYYKNALGRSDRIIWALRWLRLSWLKKILDITEDPRNIGREDHDEEYRKTTDWVWTAHRKVMTELLKSNPVYGSEEGVHGQLSEFDTRTFANQLHHFVSYVDRQSANYIKAIDDLVWQWQAPDQLIDQMTRIEQEWKASRDQELPHANDAYGGAKELINFGDGYSWWNLGVQFCDDEGSSMGHCGNNSGMRKNGDILLSLRQEVSRGGERFHIPALTFILNNGYLGEMKGRGNEKPAKRYHKYIVALLKSKYIEGIKGGGYMPENNFSMYDLDQELRDDLIAVKPNLESLIERFKRLGAIPEVIEMAQDEAHNADLPNIYGIEDDGTVILQQWDDLTRLTDDVYGFAPLDAIVKVIDDTDEMSQDERDDISDAMSLEEDDVFEFLTYLPEQYIKRIADSLGLTGDHTSRKFLEKIAMYIDRSKFRRLIASSFVASASFTGIKDDPNFIDYIRLVLSIIERSASLGYAGLNWDGDLTDPIRLELRFAEFVSGVDGVMGGDEYGDDNGGFRDRVNSSEWFEPDGYNLKDAWSEYDPKDKNQDIQTWNKDGIELRKKFDGPLGLNKKKGSSDDDGGDMIGDIDHREAARWFVDHLDAVKHQSKGLFNSKKPKTEFDKLLEELRKRAGL